MTNYEKFQQLIKQGTVVKYDEDKKKNYYVSKSGKLYTVNKETHKIGQPHTWLSEHHYEFVYMRSTKKDMRVHRIVATAFVKNDKPLENDVVDHINFIKNDNRAENLQWVSTFENSHLTSGTVQRHKQKQTLKEEYHYNGGFMYDEELDYKFRNKKDEYQEYLLKQEEAYDGHELSYVHKEDTDIWAEEPDEYLEMVKEYTEQATHLYVDEDRIKKEAADNKYKDYYNGY